MTDKPKITEEELAGWLMRRYLDSPAKGVPPNLADDMHSLARKILAALARRMRRHYMRLGGTPRGRPDAPATGGWDNFEEFEDASNMSALCVSNEIESALALADGKE